MKIYLLVDKPKTGKTTLLKEHGYTFCSDSGGRFSSFVKAIYEGKKKIAIDDYTGKGDVKQTLKEMWKDETLIYEQRFKNPVSIFPSQYQKVEVVLVTTPEYLNEISIGLITKCLVVSVEEFKRLKEYESVD